MHDGCGIFCQWQYFGNDVSVNVRGGATCNNSKQSLHTCAYSGLNKIISRGISHTYTVAHLDICAGLPAGVWYNPG